MTTDYIAFDATQTATIIDFPAGTFELAQAKAHGLRALVGLLADRDSACRLPHPFCGPPPGPGAAEHWLLIAFATSQQDENTGAPIISPCTSAPPPRRRGTRRRRPTPLTSGNIPPTSFSGTTFRSARSWSPG